MLKIPKHQVAGHSASRGQLGPLVDGTGRFYKPLQNDGRGSRELAFYRSLSDTPGIPKQILKYFPAFYGTQLAEASDGSGLLSHLVLEDVSAGRVRPSVIDIKIGSRTWYLGAQESYIQRRRETERRTTSAALGFRISGLQVLESDGKSFWRPSKEVLKNFTVKDVASTLRKFVSSNPSSDLEPDCKFATAVYADATLAQLRELKRWFEDQTLFHFCSASVLLMFESDVKRPGWVITKVKLVDFAHVVEGDGVIDHNFLGGICSLIKFISDIVKEAGFQLANSHSHRVVNDALVCENGDVDGLCKIILRNDN